MRDLAQHVQHQLRLRQLGEVPAAPRHHLPPARRQRRQRPVVRALGTQRLRRHQPARRLLPAAHHRQRHRRERPRRLDLARRRIDPVHLRIQVGPQQLLRHRQHAAEHLGQAALLALEPFAVARMRGLDQHRARDISREAAREQLRMQAAQRMGDQQVRRREFQRGEQLAQAVDHHRARLRQHRRAAAAHAEAVPGEHAADRLDVGIEAPPALERDARAIEQHQRGHALAGQHVLERARGGRVLALARQRTPEHLRLRLLRCRASPGPCPRIRDTVRH